MENSPRATSVPPARQRAPAETPARFAAQYPVAIFVSAVTTASASAGSSTGGMLEGSVCRPKKTKKTAAKRSRSGARRWCAPSATSPESAMPTRNAPTAADTCNCCASPAITSVSPSTTSSSFSGSSLETNRETSRPYRTARTRTSPATPSATARVRLPAARPDPASSAVTMGR